MGLRLLAVLIVTTAACIFKIGLPLAALDLMGADVANGSAAR